MLILVCLYMCVSVTATMGGEGVDVVTNVGVDGVGEGGGICGGDWS